MNIVKANVVARKHVLADILPYLCIFADCHMADFQFRSRSIFLAHLNQSHGFREKLSTATTCLFCNEALSASHREDSKLHAWHLGRHMEEVAFGVLTKPYEEWDFYYDSSQHSSEFLNDVL